ncbi:hypothetical protein C8J56DRAFT_890018 [Mycena floridula]|nr:hypothetical protein C8J56DRAFT_890018 [Mycena floridula]
MPVGWVACITREIVLLQIPGMTPVPDTTQCWWSQTNLSQECKIPCALVNWFVTSEEPNKDTGMWVVKPEYDGSSCSIQVIHLDAIACRVHLLPVYGLSTAFSEEKISVAKFFCFWLSLYCCFMIMTSPSHRRRRQQQAVPAVNIPVLHLPNIPDPPLPPGPGPGHAPVYPVYHHQSQFPFQYQPPLRPGMITQPAFQYFYPYVVPFNAQNPNQPMGYQNPNFILGQPMQHPNVLNPQQIQRRLDHREIEQEHQRQNATAAREARMQCEAEHQREQERRRLEHEAADARADADHRCHRAEQEQQAEEKARIAAGQTFLA